MRLVCLLKARASVSWKQVCIWAHNDVHLLCFFHRNTWLCGHKSPLETERVLGYICSHGDYAQRRWHVFVIPISIDTPFPVGWWIQSTNNQCWWNNQWQHRWEILFERASPGQVLALTPPCIRHLGTDIQSESRAQMQQPNSILPESVSGCMSLRLQLWYNNCGWDLHNRHH
jgi:hypothetical protein